MASNNRLEHFYEVLLQYTTEHFYKVLLGMTSEKNDEKLLSFPHRAKDGV